jgi:hypothetical protein
MFLSSKYPIICATMNQVSDYNLADAAAKAGITPGVFIGQITDAEIESYMNDHYHTNLIMSCRIENIINNLSYFIDRKIKFIEILSVDDIIIYIQKNPKGLLNKFFDILRNCGIKFIIKGNNDFSGLADVITIQGKESAGVSSEFTTLEQFNNKKHDLAIVSGGIHSPEQVNYYMSNGAAAVSIGTLFAACLESKLSLESKNKLISSSSSDLRRIGSLKKQALVWNMDSTDKRNFTDRLSKGILNPEDGIIYCGTSVDYINSIEPIAVIVDRLTKMIP